MISRARFSFRPRPANLPGAAFGPIEFWLSRKRIIAGCDSAAMSRVENLPSTLGRIASRSKGPAYGAQFSALGDGDGEMVRPEGDQTLDEARARLELLDEPRLGFGEELRLLDRLRLRRSGRRGLGSARLDHRRWRGRRHRRSRPRSRPATDVPKDHPTAFWDRQSASGSAPPFASQPRPSWRALRECPPLGGNRPGEPGFRRAEHGRGSARHWPSTVLPGESRADRRPLRSGRPAARRSRTG